MKTNKIFIRTVDAGCDYVIAYAYALRAGKATRVYVTQRGGMPGMREATRERARMAAIRGFATDGRKPAHVAVCYSEGNSEPIVADWVEHARFAYADLAVQTPVPDGLVKIVG